ncbi:hypothetical protein GCK32_018388, partial [Trichostrongylus colubriformis]
IYEPPVTIWIYNIINVVDTISFNGILWFTLTIAVNRWTVFAYPVLHHALFRRSKVWRTVMAVGGVVLVQVTGANLLQCWNSVPSTSFTSTSDARIRHSCYHSHGSSVSFMQVMRYESYVLPVIMFLLYVYEFVLLRLASSSTHDAWASSSRQRQIEISLLSQAVIITLFLELQTASFTILPKIATGFNK